MIVLRALCFVVGMLTLIGGSFLLLPYYERGALSSTSAVLLAVGGITLFAGGFFNLAISGYRASRSLPMRLLAGAFALFQLGVGGWLMVHYESTEILLTVAPLLCFALFAFVSFVWPAARNRAYRPLRRREEADHVFRR